ncbi:putative guanylate-binding protein [Plasmopara halstedii]
MTPVCFIKDGNDGLHITDAGLSLLQSLNEPVAIVCLAGQYRTGKSFFLNQLASRPDDLPWMSTSVKSLVASAIINKKSDNATVSGFRVGSTTESCTRGIWLWAPQPPIRNPIGHLVLFLDTEGMASTDNDESYDTKIFSLGLLLSSLFVYNTIGVIDEGAMDRLYLVSELTKHVCISAHSSAESTSSKRLDVNFEEIMLTSDKSEISQELAPHFPPFVWLLRDFLLDMQIDGNDLTANEYLEKALDAREVSLTASESTKTRQIERNRTRASIRTLFRHRECLTLVRPVTNERELRNAAELSDSELRPEFVKQMSVVRHRLLSSVAAKKLLGKTLNGPQVAHLAQCYVKSINNGAVPDIKAASEYVSDATCQAALAAAIDLYDQLMLAASCTKPAEKVYEKADLEDSDEVEGDTDDGGSDEAVGGPKILSQMEFEAIHKDAQEQAFALFKVRSVEGASRASYFHKLKQHIHVQRTTLIAQLQKRSSKHCIKVLTKLRAKFLTRPLAAGAWDTAATKEEAFQATLQVLEEVYEQKARGPAKKKVFYQFLRCDLVAFFETLYQRMESSHEKKKTEWDLIQKQLEQQHASENREWKQDLEEKGIEIQQLFGAKAHLEDKVNFLDNRILEAQHASEEQLLTIAALKNERKSLKRENERLQTEATDLSKDLEKTQLRLQHKTDTLTKVEAEAQDMKKEMTESVERLYKTHQREKEDWMRRAADQVAEKTMLQKELKIAVLNAQKRTRDIELLEIEQRQLRQSLNVEVNARARLEKDYTLLCDKNNKKEQKIKLAKSVGERERARLETRLQRIQAHLGQLAGDREIEEVLRDCVSHVVRQADKEKIKILQEERRMLQKQLGDLHEKISTLPDFYIRQIFCAPEPVTSFFEALTSVVSNPSQ